MMIRNCPALLALPLVAACATLEAPAQDNDIALPEDSCGAADYQQFVGQTSPAITVPAGTVVRHYRTGDPVTMDLRADRINFEYDRSGVLVKVSCG